MLAPYALLNAERMLDVQHRRLLELERQHYLVALKLGELDALGAPADAPERQGLEAERDVAAAAMAWHHHLLGIKFDQPQRVAADVDKSTGDDSADEPVGEESTT